MVTNLFLGIFHFLFSCSPYYDGWGWMDGHRFVGGKGKRKGESKGGGNTVHRFSIGSMIFYFFCCFAGSNILIIILFLFIFIFFFSTLGIHA